MGAFYLTLFLGVAISSLFYYLVIPPVDRSIARKVIFGQNNEQPTIFAHRGGCHEAPENTLVSFEIAKQNKAYGIEIDISFSKDNVAVLLHDSTVDRTTDGTGSVQDFTLEELQALDATTYHPFSEKFKKEGIPTLEEAVKEALRLDLSIIFDLKDPDMRTVQAMTDLYTKYPILYEKGMAASFYPWIIYMLRRSDPKIVTALTWRPLFVGYEGIPDGPPRFTSWPARAIASLVDPAFEWFFHRALWYITGVSAVMVHKDVISQEYAKMWHDRQIYLLAWTPNHPLEKQFLTDLVNIPIITDTLH